MLPHQTSYQRVRRRHQIVVNAQPATPAPTAGTVTQPTCAATAVSKSQYASNNYTFTPSVVSISGTGLVTASSGTYTPNYTAGCTSPASSYCC
jgi:hypothetical protein